MTSCKSARCDRNRALRGFKVILFTLLFSFSRRHDTKDSLVLRADTSGPPIMERTESKEFSRFSFALCPLIRPKDYRRLRHGTDADSSSNLADEELGKDDVNTKYW
jgi:hypothetical protein